MIFNDIIIVSWWKKFKIVLKRFVELFDLEMEIYILTS